MKNNFLFQSTNYKTLLIGICIIGIGFVLMVGGNSDNPNEFSEDIFSFRRIHLSPGLILIGLGICFYSIFKKNQHTQQ